MGNDTNARGRPRLCDDSSVVEADFYEETENGRLRCEVCPRRCRLREGQRGLCFVREARGGKVVLTTYARASGLVLDPIEKKPLYHFLPGTEVLSFGTAGCNLTCKYCQNWHLSRAATTSLAAKSAEPNEIAALAERLGASSVAFTYNDPVVFLEYAVDVADLCRERGIRTVAVSNGYILPRPGRRLFGAMDAVNIDLKSFSEGFYRRMSGGHLGPVLETIERVHHETGAWLELTTLLVPGENDSPEEIDALIRWVLDRLGPSVPLHFSAFHPAFKMLQTPRTPKETLSRARSAAIRAGVRYAYTGNVHDPEGSTTLCPGCGDRLIVGGGFGSVQVNLDPGGLCPGCGAALAGVFD